MNDSTLVLPQLDQELAELVERCEAGRPDARRKPAPSQAAPATPSPAQLAKQLRSDGDKGRSARTRYPISAYVGMNGSGKTLCMVHDTLPSLFNGRDIYTTVPLRLPDGTVPSNVHLLTDWAQVLNAEHADILLDEVSAIASARETEALPPQIATLLQQLRKRDLLLRWTAPSWMRADRILRETTRLITICRGFFPRRLDDSKWCSSTLFHFLSYDAGDYTDFSSLNSTKKRLKPLQGTWYRLQPHLAKDCYDTLAQVTTIGTVLMSGRCAVCGGRRRVPECSCDEYQELMHRK